MDKPNFQFRRRQEKLDWKKLAAMDVDQITRTVDYRALQESIRQITYCDAASEFDVNSVDPNLMKVFRMSQLIIEYLLQSQDFLANNLANAERRLNSTLEELDGARARERRSSFDMRLGQLPTQTSSTVMTMAGHQRCPICQKVFINTTYLQSHMMRRHNMLHKQSSNQTLSTVTHEQSTQRNYEAELEQVRQRLRVAEQQLSDERRRAAAIEAAGESSPPDTIKEEPHNEAGYPVSSHPASATSVPGADDPPAAGSRAGSGAGSRAGSGAGSRAGSGAGSRAGSGAGSRAGSGAGSRIGSGAGSRVGSGAGSRVGSGAGSRAGSGTASPGAAGGGSQAASVPASGFSSPGVCTSDEVKNGGGGGFQPASDAAPTGFRNDDKLTQLLEQQAAEIRQLREELERQRRIASQTPLQNTVDYVNAGSVASDAASVQKEFDKQSRREVVALEGKMEAQERYWQGKLSDMRRKHDDEVDCMRRRLEERDGAAGGSRGGAEYVTIDSSPEESPRLLRYSHRHQSPSPGPAPPSRGRMRPILGRGHRRSRSESGCRRIKFDDDDDRIDEEDEAMQQDGFGRGGGLGRQAMEMELNDRLLTLGIEPGTRRITSDEMFDKMQHLHGGRRDLEFGDRRQLLDDDVNQRIAKFGGIRESRSSRLATFAKGMLNRGASLISIGNKGSARVPSSATIDAQLMQRAMAMSQTDDLGHPRAGGAARRAASHSPGGGRRSRSTGPPLGRRYDRYDYGYDDDEEYDSDFDDGRSRGRRRPAEPQPPFQFRPSASKHILERFTRKSHPKGSLIKSVTIHRVNSDEEDGTYERLQSTQGGARDKPPSGSATSLSKQQKTSVVVQSSSATSGGGLRPDVPDDGFATPLTRTGSKTSQSSRRGTDAGSGSTDTDSAAGSGASIGVLLSPPTRASGGASSGFASPSKPLEDDGAGSIGSPTGVSSPPPEGGGALQKSGSGTSGGARSSKSGGVGRTASGSLKTGSVGTVRSGGAGSADAIPQAGGASAAAVKSGAGSRTSSRTGSVKSGGRSAISRDAMPQAGSAGSGGAGSVKSASGSVSSVGTPPQAGVEDEAAAAAQSPSRSSVAVMSGAALASSQQGGSRSSLARNASAGSLGARASQAESKHSVIDDEVTATVTEPSPGQAMDARPSGSANTLSTSQWNHSEMEAAEEAGGGAPDTSVTEDTTTDGGATSDDDTGTDTYDTDGAIPPLDAPPGAAGIPDVE